MDVGIHLPLLVLALLLIRILGSPAKTKRTVISKIIELIRTHGPANANGLSLLLLNTSTLLISGFKT